MEARKQLEEESSRIDALAESKVSMTKRVLKERFEASIERQNETHKSKMHKLEKVYRKKTHILYTLTYGSTFYGYLATAFTAVNSPRFSSDLIAVCGFSTNFFTALWKNALLLASEIWELNKEIPYDYIDVLIPGLLAVLGFVVIFGGVSGLICFGLYEAGKFYKENLTDEMGMMVTLVSLAFLVWFADTLTFISWNLVVIFLLIQMIYGLIHIQINSKYRY